MGIKSYDSKVDQNGLDRGENQRGRDAEQWNDGVWNVKNNVKGEMDSIQSITNKGVIVNGEHNEVDRNGEAEHDGKGGE